MPDTPPASIQAQNPVALLRALKGPAASCLLALVMGVETRQTPATCAWLEHVTGYSANTVSDALRVLLDLGLVQRPSRNGGIQLAAGVRQLLLASPGPPLDPEVAHASNYATSTSPSPSAPETEPQNPPPQASLRARATDSESLSQAAGDHQPPSPDSVSDASPQSYPIDVARLLNATLSLFGEPVHGSPERYPDGRLLLASIAEAFDRRARLRHPARVVYANLKNGSLPAERYRLDPLRYLPEDFLRQAGLPLPRRSPGYGGWESSEATEVQDGGELDPEGDASLELPASRDGARSAGQVWQVARAILAGHFQTQTYNQFIAPLCLARFDPVSVTFVFLARDEYRRRWLEERCTRLFQQTLGGVCQRQVGVVFQADQI